MKLTENKSVIQSKVIAYQCDVCGKNSKGVSDKEFYNFNSHHGEWGNDSVDSFETHDVCSVRCYTSKIKELIADNNEYSSFEADEKSLTFLKSLVSYLYK